MSPQRKTPLQAKKPMRRTPLARHSKKPRKCPECGTVFVASRAGQKVCESVKCAMSYAQRQREKVRKKQIVADRKAFRETDRSWWLKATQADVNAWVRWRDRDKPCITCGKPPQATKQGGARDAGHYLTRAAYSALRFDTRQIFAQCVVCNRYNSGRRHEYRLAMIEKHGPEFVEWLESQTQPKKWDIDELKEIRAHYRKLLRDAQREAETA